MITALMDGAPVVARPSASIARCGIDEEEQPAAPDLAIPRWHFDYRAAGQMTTSVQLSKPSNNIPILTVSQRHAPIYA